MPSPSLPVEARLAAVPVVAGQHLPALEAARHRCDAGPRRHSLVVEQRRHAGQRLALEELHRGAAAGRHVRDRRSSSPKRRTALTVSPPPTTLVAADSDDRPRRRPACRPRSRRPRTAPWARSRRPCRRGADRSRTPLPSRGRCRGPCSPPGSASPATTRCRRAGLRAAAATTTSVGSRNAQALAAAAASACARDLLGAVLDPRGADRQALRLEQREAHGAADQHGVGQRQHLLDDADLVGHLGAAEDDDERPLGVAQQARRARRARASSAGRPRRAARARCPRSRRARDGPCRRRR